MIEIKVLLLVISAICFALLSLLFWEEGKTLSIVAAVVVLLDLFKIYLILIEVQL